MGLIESYLEHYPYSIILLFIVDAMSHKEYSNFVRSTSPHSQARSIHTEPSLKGEEAKKLYLEEVNEISHSSTAILNAKASKTLEETKDRKTNLKRKLDEVDTSNKNLFLSVQNDDIITLKKILNACPDKINIVDEFGWSLLMIACQAHSVNVAKELLIRGVDISVRDKAGNSARKIVINNNSVALANILLNAYKLLPKFITNPPEVKPKEEYVCEICNCQTFPDKQEHLSSTIHNINASKGKKIPANYKIPETNKGYQMMLKDGWDKESGLGRDGSGKKYPIKTVQKLDKKGLGLEKKNSDCPKERESTKNKKKLNKDYHENKRFEANFRREFY